MKKRTGKKSKRVPAHKKCLYTLKVFIVDGLMTDEFIEQNRVISRTLEIRGDQTLEDLHHAVFDAFDREEEHMYEFQFGGKGPNDPNAKRYCLPFAIEEFAGDLTQTSLDSLNLKIDERFGYWFDYGDDWWHQINVVSIKESVPKGVYPKVTKQIGKSPPQYMDADE